MQIWKYIAKHINTYFAVLLLGIFAWITTLPQVKTGAEWATNSTLSTWTSDMNILVPVALFWFVIIVLAIFIGHMVIGIITKQYKKTDADPRIDEILTILKNRTDNDNDKQTPKP